MPTKAQIDQAKKLLDKVKEDITLRGRDGNCLGEIRRHINEPVVFIQEPATISLETLERWVKQVKAANRKQLI